MARWKVEKGNHINVWKDPWIRGRLNPFVRSPMVSGQEDLRVKDLLIL